MEATDYAAYVDPSVSEEYDDGTMPQSVANLAEAVVGHRIVAVDRYTAEERRYGIGDGGYQLTLDSGKRVRLGETQDCCAYTEIHRVIPHLPSMEHIITAVTTSEGYDRWHILADAGQVLEIEVGWSCGNPFYYAYGLEIEVVEDE